MIIINASITNFLPIITLFIGVLILLFVEASTNAKRKNIQPILAFLTLLASLSIATYYQEYGYPTVNNASFHALFRFGAFYYFFALVSVLASIIVVMVSWKDISNQIDLGVFYSLLLIANIGAFLIGASESLASLYVGYEMLSIATYAMIGFRKSSKSSAEAAMKYFLLGALSSAILLFGISLYYFATGTLSLTQGANALLNNDNKAFSLLVIAILIAGASFKISAVPFHVWAPDVYYGAPLSVTNYLAVGSKKAAVAFVFKLFLVGAFTVQMYWGPFWFWIAILTMIVGNFAALMEDSLIRMLTYSSIGQVGYILIALLIAAGGNKTLAYQASGLHIIAHVFMKGLAFAATFLIYLNLKTDNITKLRGYAKKDPLTAFTLSIALLSLAGIPPLIGFWGKYFLFLGAVQSGYMALAFVGIVASATSLYYYSRVIYYMYVLPLPEDVEYTGETSLPVKLTISILSVLIVIGGAFIPWLFNILATIQ